MGWAGGVRPDKSRVLLIPSQTEGRPRGPQVSPSSCSLLKGPTKETHVCGDAQKGRSSGA